MEINKALTTIENEIDLKPFIEASEDFKIKSEEGAKQALSMGMQARDIKKRLEAKRKDIIKPHFDFQRAVNAFVKEYTNTLADIESKLQEKLEYWLELNSMFEPNFSNLMIEVNEGKMSSKEVWKFKVDDLEKVTREFLMIDEKKVKESIKMGIRKIEGVDIFVKTEYTMRCKSEGK